MMLHPWLSPDIHLKTQEVTSQWCSVTSKKKRTHMHAVSAVIMSITAWEHPAGIQGTWDSYKSGRLRGVQDSETRHTDGYTCWNTILPSTWDLGHTQPNLYQASWHLEHGDSALFLVCPTCMDRTHSLPSDCMQWSFLRWWSVWKYS
jgi:hypothetical protein